MQTDNQYSGLKYAYYILDKGKKECDLTIDPWERDENWEISCFARHYDLVKLRFITDQKDREKLDQYFEKSSEKKEKK